MKLSIIVPVYNVEQYLEYCVQAIMAQGVDDCEVLLIDDGSTDCSGMLCDELQKRYECISVVHQPNGGLSAARNCGLDRAKGEYITFVDSDDELCIGTLKENLAYLTNHPEVDMLEYPVEVHAGGADAYSLTFSNETQRTDIFVDWVLRGGYRHCFAWNKIYRAHLWQSLRFPIGEYYEDVSVMPSIIRQCQCVRYSNIGCYRYVLHEGSITTSYRYSKQRQLFSNNYRLYLEVKDVPALRDEALRLWVGCLNQLIDMGRCADVDKADYEGVVGMVGKCCPPYKTLLKAVPNMVTRIKLLPLFLLGLETYCRCYVALTRTLLP